VAVASAAGRARRRAQRRSAPRRRARDPPALADATAVPATRGRRSPRHRPDLVVVVAAPAVPPANTAAERRRRHLVTRRTLAGGSRSPQGTATRMALASLFGTAQARGQDPLLTAASLLTSGHL
jgi:hypothetical protein